MQIIYPTFKSIYNIKQVPNLNMNATKEIGYLNPNASWSISSKVMVVIQHQLKQ